jgi:hypothetical protein
MRFPSEWYQMQQSIAHYFPTLRPAQQRGLTLWVYGAILAQSACQNAVISALAAVGFWPIVRQRLREWLYDGPDKARPCNTRVEVALCFAPLLRWLLSWWQGNHLALAIDATLHGDRVCALVISVLYRGNAIPVAWQILPANEKGPWLSPILDLLHPLAPVVPQNMTVLVLADRGLWSPRLWTEINSLGWHPLMRIRGDTVFQSAGGTRLPAIKLVPGPGHAWVGRGTAFRAARKHRWGTLVVVWGEAQTEPWLVLTDLAPEDVGVCWYGLRVWIELGFRALKGVGWQWQHTRRTNPDRVARHWLVLAVAMLWVLAYGTRAEDAAALGLPPGQLRRPPPDPRWVQQRKTSLFRQGWSWLTRQLLRGQLWRRLWLAPEPWPAIPHQLHVIYHVPT